MNQPVALVTGAARGLGTEVARQLAAAGYAVIVAARDADSARATAAELGHPARGLSLDITDDASVAAAARDIGEHEGRLDVLVNNAAAYVDWGELPSAADLDAAHAVMETNLFGAWRTSQAFLPLLQAGPHPRLVNVASGAGSHGDEGFGLATGGGTAATYGISKAALLALTSRLAAELADSPVVVNAVCPGLTATWPGAEEMGARPMAEGAASVVWAVTVDDDGPRGGFFRDGAPVPW